MGWGLIINQLYLSRISKSTLEENKEDEEQYARSLENELIALSSYTSQVYRDSDEVEHPLVEWVIRRVPEIV